MQLWNYTLRFSSPVGRHQDASFKTAILTILNGFGSQHKACTFRYTDLEIKGAVEAAGQIDAGLKAAALGKAVADKLQTLEVVFADFDVEYSKRLKANLLYRYSLELVDEENMTVVAEFFHHENGAYRFYREGSVVAHVPSERVLAVLKLDPVPAKES